MIDTKEAYLIHKSIEEYKDINSIFSFNTTDIIGSILLIENTYIQIKVKNPDVFNDILLNTNKDNVCAGMMYRGYISRYIPDCLKDLNLDEDITVVDNVKDNALVCFDLIIRNPHGGKMEE